MFEFDPKPLLKNPALDKIDKIVSDSGFYCSYLIHDEGLPTHHAGLYLIIMDDEAKLDNTGFSVNIFGEVVPTKYLADKYAFTYFPDFAWWKLEESNIWDTVNAVAAFCSARLTYLSHLQELNMPEIFHIGILDRELMMESELYSFTKTPIWLSGWDYDLKKYARAMYSTLTYKQKMLSGEPFTYDDYYVSPFYDNSATEEENKKKFFSGRDLRHHDFPTNEMSGLEIYPGVETEFRKNVLSRFPNLVFSRRYWYKRDNGHEYFTARAIPGKNFEKMAYFISRSAFNGLFMLMKSLYGRLATPELEEDISAVSTYINGFCAYDGGPFTFTDRFKCCPDTTFRFSECNLSTSIVPMEMAELAEKKLMAGFESVLTPHGTIANIVTYTFTEEDFQKDEPPVRECDTQPILQQLPQIQREV